MHLTRRVLRQLIIFAIVSATALAIMIFGYVKLPSLLFGVGHYNVTMALPNTGGLYKSGNVTYRGTEVGRVESIHLTKTGVDAVLFLNSDIPIPSDLDAQIHSVSAIGEQYVALLPRNGTSRPLRNGDVIPVSRVTVPPNISTLLDATNRGLQAIPHDNLKTVVDESYTAFAGLGPDISRFVKGGYNLAIDASDNLDPLLKLIDQAPPVLNSQTETSDSVQAWAAHLAKITTSVQQNDTAFRGVIQNTGPAVDEVRALLDRIKPTLPIVLANLVSVNQVLITYQPDLEQILVLLPQGAAAIQGINVANTNTKQSYKGAFLSFNLNLNLPPPCTTGFLPVQQQRAASEVDYPDRPPGDLYCRVPQDSPLNVRGARNTPCETVPGKRAPTVEMCESNNYYVPLNDGFNWKGDQNATLSGQGIPQRADNTPPAPGPAPAPPVPSVDTATYDPNTGTYVAPDGQIRTQSNLVPGASTGQTWQSMLLPPKGN